MKEKYHSLSPFNQSMSLLVMGVVSYMLISVVFSLVVAQLYPEVHAASVGQQIKQYPIHYMVVYFLPTQLGLMLTPGILYLILSKNTGKVLKAQPSLKTIIWSFALFISVFFLLPFLSEVNMALLKPLGLLEGGLAKKVASDGMLTTLIGEVGSNSFYFAVITIGVLTGIAEELAFRRFLFHHLLRNTNKLGLSIFSSALLFTLLHFNYLQFLPLFAFGVALTLMYYHSGSLIPGILVHALNNMLNVYWLATDSYPSWLEEIDLKLTIPSTLLLLGLVYLFLKKK